MPELVVTLAASDTLAASEMSAAQETVKIPRVGVILFGEGGPILEAFRKGLGELGYVEGRNIVIEPRFAQGQLDRVPALAAELVRLNVDVTAAVGAVAARAAQKATTKLPIVFAAVIDPVAVGFAANLERPGGNITGITSFDPQQPRKQLELLKEVIPNLAHVAILSDQDIPHSLTDPGWSPLERANDTAARSLGLQPQMHKIKGPAPDLEGAFAAMIRGGAEALLVLEVPVTFIHRQSIGELAAKHRLATMFPGGYANADGLITLGTSIVDTVAPMPRYVDKILKGAKPGDLPIEVITRRELVVNLKTAREIGVTIPPDVVKRADQVIQ